MRQLDVTDDQYEYLERVRETLEAEYLGPYGRVDIEDALQYLVDVHEATAPEMPRADTEVVAAADARRSVDSEPSAAHGSAGAEPSPADAHDDAVEIVEAVAGDATVEHAGGGVEPPEHDGSAGDEEGGEGGVERPEPTVGGPDAPAPTESGDDGTVSAESDGDAADPDEGTAPGPSGDGPASGGPDRLQAMMNLLDTHEGKWREGDGEGRYEVDLPDGSTETVQTRDDVRAVLFKNYR
jgi:hypothetical protein